MGQLKASELNEQLIETLANTEVGTISDPIERPNGAVSIMVCEREATGSDIPTRDAIEDRLIDQQLAQASRRALRDIRRKATIVVR
jgi:peptidyl-prolyl cis-trans isomerase SurA